MNSSVSKGATLGFILAIAVLLASGWLSYRNIQRISRHEALVVHTHEALDALHDVMATLVNAETGQRGYIITGEAAYMEPYRAAAGALKGHLDRLQQLTADNPTQQRRLAALKETSGRRITTLAEGIAARDQGGPEAGRQFVLQGKGKQQMEANRVLIAEMNKTESDLLGVREAESRTSCRTALGTVLVTTLLGLGLVATAYGLSAREAGTRRRSAESLRRANDELEARVEERTADLASAVESLRRSNRELEQFASVASHDLQEPLRKI